MHTDVGERWGFIRGMIHAYKHTYIELGEQGIKEIDEGQANAAALFGRDCDGGEGGGGG